MSKRTPLHAQHLDGGARMVGFGGWDMPVHYGSQIEEHHAVRREAGMFDVSHMTRLDVEGDGAADFLRSLLANDVARLDRDGRALYTCMLNERAGILDDLIVYRLESARYRLIVNAATRDKDLEWIRERLAGHGDAAHMTLRDDLAMIAVQGPRARRFCEPLLPAAAASGVKELRPFHAIESEGWLTACTGYTGEDGLEIMLPNGEAPALWEALADAGVQPCGLGARDTLRLEAGLNLYGQDMDEQTTPLESNLAWTVAWEPASRGFIGRDALERQREEGPARRLTGLLISGRGIARAHHVVDCGSAGSGEVTSGSFSPTLEAAIGLARVPAATADGESCQVEVRGRKLPARLVKPPFVRNGRVLVDRDN